MGSNAFCWFFGRLNFPIMSFLALASPLFDPRPSSPSSCLLFQSSKGKKNQESSTKASSHVTSLSLSLPVSLCLHSFLNQEKVAWARLGVCQKITLPAWVSAPGLWLAPWFRLCSWLSTPYRSTRKGGRWGEVLFTRLVLRRLNL